MAFDISRDEGTRRRDSQFVGFDLLERVFDQKAADAFAFKFFRDFRMKKIQRAVRLFSVFD